MKRILFLSIALSLLVGACLPAVPASQENPTPISEADLQVTAAVLAEQTLQALPTDTSVPSKTPIVVTPSQTATQPTPTETVNPVLLTLTATLLAGTPTLGTETAITGTVQSVTESVVANPSATLGTPQPLSYGTLPPNLPYGTINLFNKSHVDVYISLRCVTKDGSVTILEYPVKQNFKISAPAGKYTYIAWVGGRQFDGSFTMDDDGFFTITFFKERVNVKKD